MLKQKLLILTLSSILFFATHVGFAQSTQPVAASQAEFSVVTNTASSWQELSDDALEATTGQQLVTPNTLQFSANTAMKVANYVGTATANFTLQNTFNAIVTVASDKYVATAFAFDWLTKQFQTTTNSVFDGIYKGLNAVGIR